MISVPMVGLLTAIILVTLLVNASDDSLLQLIAYDVDLFIALVTAFLIGYGIAHLIIGPTNRTNKEDPDDKYE